MNLDDIIYILLLFASIAFGYFYRTIDEDQIKRKRWIGSAFGVLLIVVVSGYHTLHILFSFGVTTLLILAFDVGYVVLPSPSISCISLPLLASSAIIRRLLTANRIY